MSRFKLEVTFEGKQSELESEDCYHHYRGQMIFLVGEKLCVVERDSICEIDLTKPIRNLKISLVKGE